MIPSVSYYLFKNRVNGRGESSVFIRFTQARKSSYVNTNIKVPAKFWDPIKQRMKKGCNQANLINLLLDKKMLDTKEKLLNQALRVNFITSRKAKESITSSRSNNFFGLAEQYINELKLKGKVGTVDKVESIFNKFATFMGTKNVTLYDVDEDLLNRYQDELRKKHKNKPNTIHSNLKTIRRYPICYNKYSFLTISCKR
jgi:integrase/recombinase XerD